MNIISYRIRKLEQENTLAQQARREEELTTFGWCTPEEVQALISDPNFY